MELAEVQQNKVDPGEEKGDTKKIAIATAPQQTPRDEVRKAGRRQAMGKCIARSQGRDQTRQVASRARSCIAQL